MDINNFYNAKELATYHGKVKESRGLLLGEKFFPLMRSSDMSITWAKGFRSKNVVLAPSALDVKAVIRTQRSTKSVREEMPYFKESMLFTEEQRRKCIEGVAIYGEKVLSVLFQSIYKQYGELVDGASIQLERMRMLALSLGNFDFQSDPATGNTVSYSVQYDTDGEWAANNNLAITGTSQWTDANKATSDPVNDILEAINTHQAQNGASVGQILMNSATLKSIMGSDSVKKYIQPFGGAVTRRAVSEFIETEGDVKLHVYDKSYINELGASSKFYPNGYVSLLPSEPVGQTVCGATPTEWDLLGKDTSDSSVAVTAEGVAIQTVTHRDPVNVETIVSSCGMPSFEGMEKVYVVKGY